MANPTNFFNRSETTMEYDPASPELNQEPELLKTVLNKEGFRFTSQRQKILDLFQSAALGHHLNAEEIHQQLLERGEKISFSTIYRALHVMVRLGLLQELELAEGRKYYELNTPFMDQHHHLVCVHCGNVEEFEDATMTQVGSSESTSRGFSLLNCQFTVYGICPSCQSLLG
ncbi:Fur family transcriptional regulator [Nodosilinea sp. LEGE 07298]|jgi:Fur family ferric uptake transcriptional regulator|uniref:Fur family transcriptional regulator n=1 Tax=Nodosilinea sp. LEGE 07298 TaxID=2777970 RepID=UPI001D1522B1|nr:Fur family transcriptional regulator [Nodosilinea sp. LEGE 07298]